MEQKKKKDNVKHNNIYFSRPIIAATFFASFLACFFSNPANALGNSAYEVYMVKTMTNAKILPTTYPIPSIGTEINVSAAPGEYEPASFVVHTLQPISGIQASATNLTSGANVIPASAVDIRVVKNWFQAGVAVDDTSHIALTPELLLKDNNLIKVDLAAQKNYLRQPDGNYVCISDTTTDLSNIQPQDAATLQPVDIDANYNQQYWVNVQVPDGTPAGTYQGTIILTSTSAPNASIPIKVTVLPFALEKSALIYSIYYHGDTWVGYNVPTMEGALTSQQYLAEMKDLKTHGVEYPALQAYPGNTANLKLELDLRKQAGLPAGPLFNLGISTNPIPTTQAELDVLKAKVQERISIAWSYGFTDIYFYGKDEAYGIDLTNQRPAWQAVHDAGGKVFVSSSDVYFTDDGLKDYDSFGMVGDLLDVAVEWGPLRSSIAQKYHSIGHKAFSYSNPQVGIEEPETYRRNYGLSLWKAGYDGAMNASYQLRYNNIWNDFDAPVGDKYRDHVFAYPTIDGVIDTIQWEGWREGVDDTRYRATLQKAIDNNKATKPQLATEAQTWLNNLNTSSDLDAIRATMIDYITRLGGGVTSAKADLNSDTLVNQLDLDILKQDFLKFTVNLLNPKSDIDGDGQATIKDVGIMMSGWK